MAALLLLLAALLGGAGWLYTPDLDRAVLLERYAGPPSTFVSVAGLRLHVRDSGPASPIPEAPDAPALILLHGFGASLHTWEPWALALQQQYRVIRFDLPGAGLTGADPSGDYSDERAVEIITALLDRLGVRRAAIVGHSMGGRIAARFAAEQPQRVTKLVLIAPDGFASPGFDYDRPPEIPAAAQLLPYTLPKPLLRMALAHAYADQAALTEARLTRYHELLLAPQVRTALLARMRTLVLRDPRPLLAGIRAPTLLLWGERDALIPAAHAGDYLAALPQARLLLLPGVGHVPQEEAADLSLQAVETFLAE